MILEKARELGLALSESDEFMRMAAARLAVEENEEVRQMVDAYQTMQEELVALLSSDNMDRHTVTTLSNDIEETQNRLLLNPLFTELLEAQNAFQQLMAQVNHEITACIGLTDRDTVYTVEAGCGGSCSTCAGCKH